MLRALSGKHSGAGNMTVRNNFPVSIAQVYTSAGSTVRVRKQVKRGTVHSGASCSGHAAH